MQFGLLGESLSHSYSPQIHKLLGNYSYSLFEKKEDELDNFLLHGNFRGINVTAPYKKAVIPYCATLTDCARSVGAVNTIVRDEHGKLLGHNSDYFGFQYMLRQSGLRISGKKVLILGSGGASATVQAVAREMNASVVVISRSGGNNYQNLHLHTDAAVIVNTTPVGMYPAVGATPIDLAQFDCLEGVLDLIYNPARTKLIMDAQNLGLKTSNGLWMLVAQAKESAQWFLGQPIPDSMIEQIHDTLHRQMENIVLIGMPGCGKTTVGSLLAEITGKQFVDSDAEIVKRTGMVISDIFKDLGEDEFRNLETQILSELGKKSCHIIATGGGCVEREENYPLLHQNGKVIWLQRDIKLLPHNGRPLSQQIGTVKIYESRKQLYEHFADQIIPNNATAREAALAIAAVEDFL